MKNKTNKNIIIASLFTNIILFLILILSLLIYFYPNISEIEAKKENLSKLIKNYNNLKKQGLSYQEFKKIKDPNISIYQQKILSKIDKNFYEKNFVNKDNKFLNFSDFLSSLEEQINGELKEDYDKKHDKIYNVLPIYTESSDNLKNGVLTDFKFVNMIENLLYEYDLISESSLGIKEISKLDTYSENKNKSDLSADIYVIKLPLTIEGKKKNIIKFLSYVKDMGNIGICTKENVKNQEFGCKSEEQLIINNPTIFTELDSIYMDEYIDSSPFVSIDDKNKDLLYILTKTPQKNERFKIDIVLLFYVQGLPNYKIKQSIFYVIGGLPKNLKPEELEKLSRTNYNSIKARLKSMQVKYKKNKLISQQLNELDGYLQTIDKEIKKINRQIPKAKDFMSIYNKVEKYKGIFTLISNKLDEIESKNK